MSDNNLPLLSTTEEDAGCVSNTPSNDNVLPAEDEEMLVTLRAGAVLGSGTILKFDRYPISTEDFCATVYDSDDTDHNSIPKVLNYRTVPDYPIHGVGQATVSGIKQILEHLGAKEILPPSNDTVPNSTSHHRTSDHHHHHHHHHHQQQQQHHHHHHDHHIRQASNAQHQLLAPPPQQQQQQQYHGIGSSPSASPGSLKVRPTVYDELAEARSLGDRADRWVLWTCMREEPVVYINGRPFVLREHMSPFSNVAFHGISPQRVEQMEQRLKIDILEEANKNQNKILVHDESSAGNVICRWQPVNADSVLTLRELYDRLRRGEHVENEASKKHSGQAPKEQQPPTQTDDEFLLGNKPTNQVQDQQQQQQQQCGNNDNQQRHRYRVALFRIPIAGQQKPLPTHYDYFLNMFAQAPANAQFLYNCQSGRGRTTTGITVGTMLCSLRSAKRETYSIADLTGIPSPSVPFKRNTLVTDSEVATATYALDDLDAFYNNDELYTDLAQAEWARYEYLEHALIHMQ